jgi:hypothetical protein
VGAADATAERDTMIVRLAKMERKRMRDLLNFSGRLHRVMSIVERLKGDRRVDRLDVRDSRERRRQVR